MTDRMTSVTRASDISSRDDDVQGFAAAVGGPATAVGKAGGRSTGSLQGDSYVAGLITGAGIGMIVTLMLL